MNQTTKRILGIALASTLIIGASGGVIARGGFAPGWGCPSAMMGGPGGMSGPRGMRGPGGGRGMRMGGGDPVAFADQRLTRLKTTLGITPEQEAAWTAYADAVKGRAGLRAAHRQAWLDGTVTPGQRLDFRQEGLTQMQKVLDARRGLNEVLTPEQQAQVDNLVRPGGRRW